MKGAKKTTERTEEQKVTSASISVILGGVSYSINPLVIKDSREWRGKVVEALGGLPAFANATTEDTELFTSALNAMLFQMPNTVLDLFFDYAKGLDRDKIEASATDKELAIAFEQVVALAFPLAQSLVGTMSRLSQ
jgi:hypothetical protein